MTQKGSTLDFLKSQWRFLLFGFLLAFFSAPGQTFFISLFSGIIRQDLNLSHGEFGTIYAIGTIASAITLIPLGRLVDTIKLRVIAIAIIIAMAAAAAFFSLIYSTLTLVIGVYLLRVSGQGMMSHLYATAMTRRYVAERGRAFSVALFGHPVSEFIMPLFALGLLAVVGWRQVWLIIALIMLAVMIPATIFLTRRREGQDGDGLDSGASGRDGIHWTRRKMLAHWRFWMLSGLVLAPSFTGTGLFFHQIYFAEIKNIDIGFWISGFGFYAAANIIGCFVAGFLVDRFTAARIAPLSVAAIAIPVLVLYFTMPEIMGGLMVWVYFVIFGFFQGMSQTSVNPIWVEIYGSKHLGGIKAIAQSMVALASALSPAGLGLLIDRGASLAVLLSVLGIVPLIAGGMAIIAVRVR